MWELRLSTGLHRHPLRGECTSILLLGEVGHPGSLGWGEVSLPWGGGRRPALHTASTVPTPVVNRGDWLFTSRSEWKCRPCLGLYRGDGDGEEYPVTCSPPVTLRLPLDLSWHHPVGRGRKPPCWARWNFWFPTRICSWGWKGHTFLLLCLTGKEGLVPTGSCLARLPISESFGQIEVSSLSCLHLLAFLNCRLL